MDRNLIALPVICIVALFLAGCTATSPSPLNGTTITTTPTMAVTTVPVDNQTCTIYADCVPAQCCHPTTCVNQQESIHVCNFLCTASCEGPLDCGAGELWVYKREMFGSTRCIFHQNTPDLFASDRIPGCGTLP